MTRSFAAALLLAAAVALTGCTTSVDGTPEAVVGADPAPSASADRSMIEQAYLDALAVEGIRLDDDEALDLANQVCGWLDDGHDLLALVDRVMVREPHLTFDDAGYAAGAAMGAVCPEHLDNLGGGRS